MEEYKRLAIRLPLNGMLDMSVRASLVNMPNACSRSTKEEFHEFYKIQEDSDIAVIHNGCDDRVFRPPNKDVEGEQLAHERIRKEYGCADEGLAQLRSKKEDDDSRSWSACRTERYVSSRTTSY